MAKTPNKAGQKMNRQARKAGAGTNFYEFGREPGNTSSLQNQVTNIPSRQAYQAGQAGNKAKKAQQKDQS